MTDKPKLKSSLGNKELDNAEKQFEEFEKQVNTLTLDRMNQAPKRETEPQVKISQQEQSKKPEIYLKPFKVISCRDKFNEDYTKEWEFQKQYVYFTAEHKEIIGEMIEMWTKPFAGVPAEFWNIPTNKKLWAPRYVAEQLKKCNYHKLVMQASVTTGSDHLGQYHGAMVADETVQRLDARPETQNKSIFMGATNF